MRIGINLAIEPFRRERALLLASAILSGLMATALVMLGLVVWNDHQTKTEARAAIGKLDAELAEVGKNQAAVDKVLRTSGNTETLELNLFLNNLIFISWN